jgi:hypothetical protein
VSRPRYLAHVADSRRWAQVPLRDDDIVISTPSKCGTTWMQMLIALLLFDTEELPAPLSTLSPWVEMRTRPMAQTLEHLASQTHRRFLKTHVPLDGLPRRDGVTHVVVGRDPRDAWVSMQHQQANLDIPHVVAMCDDGAGPPEADPDLPEEIGARFRAQIELPASSNHTRVELAQIVHHLLGAWRARHESHVHLVHYADLQRDLPAEMVRLADALGLERSPRRCAELAEAASLSRMRADAARLAPNADDEVWHDPRRFFRSGGCGEWRAFSDAATQRRYDERVIELSGGDEAFANWLHAGRTLPLRKDQR